jgi:hypothetical protein
MTSSTPVRGSGIVTAIAGVWADIVYGQRRVIELNRPTSRRSR